MCVCEGEGGGGKGRRASQGFGAFHSDVPIYIVNISFGDFELLAFRSNDDTIQKELRGQIRPTGVELLTGP